MKKLPKCYRCHKQPCECRDGITLYHADCREILPLLEPGSVDLVLTDPPYGIGYTHGNSSPNGRSGVTVQWEPIDGDDTVRGDWLASVFDTCGDSACLFLHCRWDVEPQWREEIRAAGFRLNQRLIWHKKAGGKGDIAGTFAPTCEDVLFASRGRATLIGRPSMLLDTGCIPTWERRFHPHQKPQMLAEVLAATTTVPAQTILDPFAGSGTTLRAAKDLGRKCIGVEIEKKYCDIIVERLRKEPLAIMGKDNKKITPAGFFGKDKIVRKKQSRKKAKARRGNEFE